jgi:hypothetical protein
MDETNGRASAHPTSVIRPRVTTPVTRYALVGPVSFLLVSFVHVCVCRREQNGIFVGTPPSM